MKVILHLKRNAIHKALEDPEGAIKYYVLTPDPVKRKHKGEFIGNIIEGMDNRPIDYLSSLHLFKERKTNR